MTTVLIFLLLFIDLILLGVIYFLGKQRIRPMDLLREIHEEKRQLKELRTTIAEDMKIKHVQAKELYEKISKIAAEAELELRGTGDVFANELNRVLEELSGEVKKSVEQIARERSSISSILQKSREERQLLTKNIRRSEKLVKFFNKNIPYEEVLEEIEDKKYVDARHLLSRGLTIDEVCNEVGLPESEVKLLASMT